MRRRLLSEGAKELSYEIREIVKKANQLKALGLPIHWENIGDPIEKKCQVPDWIKDIVVDLARTNRSYGYCPSKGMLRIPGEGKQQARWHADQRRRHRVL